ncbi:MAG: hypothetical protein PHQ72_07300 [Hespellia sp.]|nr:hypothetical protein [Hespellia sp.]
MKHLLQCRPLQIAHNTEEVTMPEETDSSKILLKIRKASMGLSTAMKIDAIVVVDPVGYYNMEYKSKYEIAKAVGAINWYFQNQNKNLILFTPGRIGTSSPELGVPTTFADISEFKMICEVSEVAAGYMPELSYGSHIFQDLVEAGILYGAIFQNETTITYQPEMLRGYQNILGDILPASDIEKIGDILRVYAVWDEECYLYHDIREETMMCSFIL